MMSNLIVTIAEGELSTAIGSHTIPFMRRYAKRVGADLIVARKVRDFPGITEHLTNACLTKMAVIREGLEQYDRVLWLDADVLIRPDAPDIFAIVPETHWAGVDEAALAYSIGWEAHVHSVHNSMVEVCVSEGLPIPETHARYFNCGVQLASKAHAFLYEPIARPVWHGWAEQSMTNVRLALAPSTRVYFLPYAFNQMQWIRLPGYQRTGWFIHYCGIKWHERLAVVASDAAFMYENYPELTK